MDARQEAIAYEQEVRTARGALASIEACPRIVRVWVTRARDGALAVTICRIGPRDEETDFLCMKEADLALAAAQIGHNQVRMQICFPDGTYGELAMRNEIPHLLGGAVDKRREIPRYDG